MHGVADRIEGPYRWGVEPNLPGGINPAALTFRNSSTGRIVYSLWNGGIRVADSPYGPWSSLPGRGGCGGNPAPWRHPNGTFFCVSQHTLELTSADDLGEAFVKVSDINITLANGTSVLYAKALPNIEVRWRGPGRWCLSARRSCGGPAVHSARGCWKHQQWSLTGPP